MDKGVPSFGFPTQPYSSSQDSFELSTSPLNVQNSQDFTTPSGFPNDFVSASKGGTFSALVKYSNEFVPTLDTHLVHKGWVNDAISTAITELETGGLSKSTILGWFSSSTNSPLSYNALTGVFTLDKNLSQYTNDIGFLTEFTETDPTVGAHIKAITETNINNWSTAYGWGDHSIAGYLVTADISNLIDLTDLSVVVNSAGVANLEYNNLTGVFTYTPPDLSGLGGGIELTDLSVIVGTAGNSNLTYNNVTGEFTFTPPDLSAYLTSYTETDPIFSASAASGITNAIINNWNTAYSWGNHAGLYDSLNTASGLISTHNSTYNHALISTALQNITGESVFDLPDFPSLGTALQILRVNTDGLALEFHTLTHSDLSGRDADNNFRHLTLEQKNNIVNAATNIAPGYMTAEHVQALESALTSFTTGTNLLGAELIYDVDTNTLVLADNIPTLDDEAIDEDHVLSAAKILSLLEGNTEEGSYSLSYTITISAGADLATKLGLGSTVPTGWSLTADGGNLQITHNVEKTPIGIAVYRITSSGTKQKLEGNTAYSNAVSNSTDTMLTLSAYAGTTDATEIRLSF